MREVPERVIDGRGFAQLFVLPAPTLTTTTTPLSLFDFIVVPSPCKTVESFMLAPRSGTFTCTMCPPVVRAGH